MVKKEIVGKKNIKSEEMFEGKKLELIDENDEEEDENEEQSEENEEEVPVKKKKTIKAIKKDLESKLKWYKQAWMIACIPIYMYVMFLIFNIFYKIFTLDEVIKNWRIALAFLWLSFLMWCICYKWPRTKRIYNQLKAWTVIIKKTEIIEFRWYNRWFMRMLSDSKRITDTCWYRIILSSDGEDEYESQAFHGVPPNVNLLTKISNHRKKERGEEIEWIDYVVIGYKKYHIYDKIFVLIDCFNPKNYYVSL